MLASKACWYFHSLINFEKLCEELSRYEGKKLPLHWKVYSVVAMFIPNSQ